MAHGQAGGVGAARVGPVRDDEGQMVVELAVVAPVMIVVALVAWNLLLFMEACARFDRVVPDVVVALAVSPAGEDAESGDQAHQVSEALREAMEGTGVEVTVEATSAWSAPSGQGLGFSFAPHLTRYVCTMRFTPRPSSIAVAGVDAAAPPQLTHVRTFTIDRYRPGVLF